jgi:hypothetical protein
MKVSFIAIVLGALMLIASHFMPQYSDTKAFHSEYGKMNETNSAEFYLLREKYLTKKFVVQDVGLSIAFFGGIWALFKRFRPIRSLMNIYWYFGLALACALAYTAGYVTDLLVAFGRDEFPWWSDSLGIPLMGLPMIFIFSLIWCGLPLPWLIGQKVQSTPVASAWSRRANPVLALIAVILTVISGLYTVSGGFVYLVPLTLNLYLVVSVIAQRLHPYEN